MLVWCYVWSIGLCVVLFQCIVLIKLACTGDATHLAECICGKKGAMNKLIILLNPEGDRKLQL